MGTRPRKPRRTIFGGIRREAKELWKFRYVVISYVYTTTKIRYKRSYLGYVWTVVGPMLNYIMIGFILGLLLKDRMENYYSNYFSGALFFSVVSGVLTKAPHIMLSNEHYIKKVHVPKTIFLLNVVMYELWNFLLSATSLIIIGFATGALAFHATFPLSLVALILTAFFLIGISAIVSVATVYFRDLGHIVPLLLQALFFATPIAYSKSMLPAEYRWITVVNPVCYFLDFFRIPLVQGEVPSAKTCGISIFLALASLSTGLWVLKKFDNRIVFKL